MSIVTLGYQTRAGGNVHDKVKTIAARSARVEGLSTRCVLATERVSLYLAERSNSRAKEFAAPGPQRCTRWLLGDVNYVDGPHVAEMRTRLDDAPENPAIPGRWIVVEHDPDTDRLSLTTDRWGLLWLYFARTADGFLLSSDFGSLVSILDVSPKVNAASCALELVLGYSLGDKTIFDGVTLAPAGTRLTFSSDGTLIQKLVNPPVYGDKYAGMSTTQKLERLDEIWNETERRYFKPFSESLMVSISAGFDSRHALAICNRRKIPAKYFTFGESDSAEVWNARLNCSRVGVRNEIFTYQEAKWDEWVRCVTQVGNAGIVQWAGWADQWHGYLKRFGSSLATGIFGGPLTGTHLKRSHDERQDWVKNWMSYSIGRSWAHEGLLRPQWASWLAENLEQSFREQLAGLTFSIPHQQAIHLDYYGRQRRWTGAQPELISRFLTPVPWLYSGEFVEFWSSLGLQDLEGQRLYMTYARSRFPELFRPWERRPGRFWRIVRRIVRRIRAERIGRSLPGGRVPQSEAIAHQRILRDNEERIRQLVGTVRAAADPLIDCDVFLGQLGECVAGRRSNSQQLVRYVNLMHLLALRC